MLELDDIQHILLTRTPAMTGRYEFLSFGDPAGGRAWLTELLPGCNPPRPCRPRWTAPSAGSRWRSPGAACGHSGFPRNPWQPSRRSFARAWPLAPTSWATPAPPTPTTGWVDWRAPTCTPSRSCSRATMLNIARATGEHDELVARCDGVRVLSFLDLNATPPFNYAHDHFGFRDRLSQPVMEGSGEEPTPGSGAPLKPGEFILGYPDEKGPAANLPQPEVLSRNGSYMAYRRLQEHVGLFRDYLRENAETPDEQELLAAKFMGRWRSGAPLVLAPDKDDPELGADPMRNNDFNYKEMDPFGYAVPARLARAAPQPARHRGQYESAQDDSPWCHLRSGSARGRARRRADRGIAAFIICASLVRQFEFAQNVWINDRTFHELGNEHDPICGTQDGTMEFTIPKRPIRKVHKGLTGIHHPQGWGLLLLAGHQRDALSRGARLTR